MKIRIQGNSIRVRLVRSEVTELGEGRPVQQQTAFSPHSKLVSIIRPTQDSETATASLDASTITIAVPLCEIARWVNSEHVGIESDVRIDGHNSLRLIVEKDFECLHSRTGDADNAYPHPLAQQPSGN